MRRSSFIFAILGISFLFYFLVFGEIKIEKFKDLKDLEINSKIVLEGVVDEEKDFGTFKILKIKEIEILCDCVKSYLNEEIIVEGYVSEYLGKKQIKTLSIRNN
tara:strand:- start:498 stop:809 length:312 start_codon:yes stop_codon:yes gene_type:complete